MVDEAFTQFRLVGFIVALSLHPPYEIAIGPYHSKEPNPLHARQNEALN